MSFGGAILKILSYGTIEYFFRNRQFEEREEYKMLSTVLINTLSNIEPVRINNSNFSHSNTSRPILMSNLDVKRDDEAKEEDKKYECKVCLLNIKNTVLIPCNHCIVCNTCAIELLKTTKKCPGCRVNITNVIPFFNS
jgi:hypothetical protein